MLIYKKVRLHVMLIYKKVRLHVMLIYKKVKLHVMLIYKKFRLHVMLIYKEVRLHVMLIYKKVRLHVMLIYKKFRQWFSAVIAIHSAEIKTSYFWTLTVVIDIPIKWRKYTKYTTRQNSSSPIEYIGKAF